MLLLAELGKSGLFSPRFDTSHVDDVEPKDFYYGWCSDGSSLISVSPQMVRMLLIAWLSMKSDLKYAWIMCLM